VAGGGGALADSSYFGLLGQQSSPKIEIFLALDADKPPCKI